MTVRVFVPLVNADGDAEHLFEAIATGVAPEPHPARLVPQISELFDFGLYRTGQTVREAVTRFVDQRRPTAWLGARNARAEPWYLRISDLQVGRLSDENARSAGLGLTLAAICQAFGRNPGILFATGEILVGSGPAAGGIAVGPVGGMRGKLSLLGDYVVRHRASLAGATIRAVLPATTIDGEALETAEAPVLRRIATEAEAAGANLTVTFAERLDDVEKALGPLRLSGMLTPARAALAIVVILAVAAFWLGWTALVHAPVGLAFAPVMADAPAAAALPQRAHYDAATDKLRLLGPCYDGQRQPLVAGGEELLLKISVDDEQGLAGHVFPPRLLIAAVSRSSDPVVLDADKLRAGGEERPDGSIILVPIEPMEDEVRLFVAATREADLGPSEVLAGLKQRLEGLDGPARLAAAASFLSDRMAGVIDYQFKVTTDAQYCPT
jgi:hypothetical protein